MIPALYIQQPGLGVFTADNVNTKVDGGVLLSDLQSFIGVPGSTVYMIGYFNAGDGGQGMWTWNVGLTAGDNITSVLPFGSVQGGWTRVSFDFPGIFTYPGTVNLAAPPPSIAITGLPFTPRALTVRGAVSGSTIFALLEGSVDSYNNQYASYVLNGVYTTSPGVVMVAVSSTGNSVAFTFLAFTSGGMTMLATPTGSPTGTFSYYMTFYG